jgi:uncharacterized SAM-binding protein YcdF (DUF218 family)
MKDGAVKHERQTSLVSPRGGSTNESHTMNAAGRGTRVWFAAALLAALMAAFATQAGNLLVVNAPERADVILVLAGETDHRPALGLQLLDQGYGRQLVIDVPVRAKIFQFTEVELATKYAQDLPQAGSVRICPIEGLSTRDESHDAEKCLAGLASARILIVTSDFHTRRALSIFRHELRGRSFSVAAAYDATEFKTRWWTNRQWAKTCLNEWLRLFWWNAIDRWR